MDRQRHIAWMLGLLFHAEGVGAGTIRVLEPELGRAADLADLRDRARTVPGLGPRQRMALETALDVSSRQRLEDAGRAMLAEADERGIAVLTRDDPHYPRHFRRQDMKHAPPVLFAYGRLADDVRTVACVGTRKPSAFGVGVTTRLTTVLAEHGWTIVSGLANGLDTLAHEAALTVGVRTVAIVGNGLDRIYPAENTALAQRILEQGGLLLSEQPFGTPPSAYSLVQRNRLQSGMSVGTIVFETSLTGGARHTAQFAWEQRRLVLCPVPPPAYAGERSCSGNTWLLDLGMHDATKRLSTMPITSRDDYPHILAALEAQLEQMLADAT